MPRSAKSAALHLLQGNPNNLTKKEIFKRKKNEEKLEISSENVVAPTWLSPSAKKDFYRVKKILAPAGILTDGDVDLLAIYCDTLSDYKAAVRSVKKSRTIKGKLNPFLHEKQKLAPLLNKQANELGLTPAARASLAIHMDDEVEDDDDDF